MFSYDHFLGGNMKGLNINNLQTRPTHTGEFAPKPTRELKETDIVIWDKVGASKIMPGKNNGLFKAKGTSGFFGKLSAAFKPKARGQDMYNILRSHGMNVQQAGRALVNIKLASDNLGLSGFSAAALQREINLHHESS
jgi:hypothetical protein